MNNITKREYFAGQAMQKMIELYPARKEKDVAKTSLLYADAMISELDSIVESGASSNDAGVSP